MNKINVIIPMAGLGKRFSDAGYSTPKPLLPLGKMNMIQSVMLNLRSMYGPDFLFHLVVNKYQIDRKTVVDSCELVTDDFRVWEIDYIPNGPACSAHVAAVFGNINMEEPLIITNCDQIIEDYEPNLFLKFCETNKADGVVGVFPSSSPKNSYVRLDGNNEIIDIKEKQVISNVATNGFHWWRKAAYFEESYNQMLDNKDSVNGEYYVAPSYKYMVQKGMKVLPYWFNLHYPIGTPADYEAYKKLRGL